MRGGSRHQFGFTLVELLIAVVVFGVMSLALVPAFSALQASQERLQREQATYNNNRIAAAMRDFARQDTALGQLPTPFTGSGYVSTVYDPSGTAPWQLAFADQLSSSGVDLSRVNDDGRAARNVRVYQAVSGLTTDVPAFGATGPLVRLTYEFGVLYQTRCAIDAACNTGASASNPPGDSPRLTAANFTTWDTIGTDLEPVFISTLPIQKDRLRQTMTRMTMIREKMLDQFRVQQLAAAATATTNFHLTDGNGSPDLSGANPVSNAGCHDGWYRLDAANVDVLAQLGLPAAQYGVTAWGAPIEYCRDYDPTATDTSTAGAPPHYAALRINRDLIAAAAPDAANPANNIRLTY